MRSSHCPFDEQGRFKGLIADLLSSISIRTGLNFEAVRVYTLAQGIELVRSGQGRCVGGYHEQYRPRKSTELYPALPHNPFCAYFPYRLRGTSTLDEMAGKCVVMVRGNVLRDFIAQNYPQVQIQEADNPPAALAMVAEGSADAAISVLVNARYLVSRRFDNQLKITSTVGTQPEQIGFATAGNDQQLSAILDKALLNITPGDLSELTGRWFTDTPEVLRAARLQRP